MKRGQWIFTILLLCTLLAAAVDRGRVWVNGHDRLQPSVVACEQNFDASPHQITCADYSEPLWADDAERVPMSSPWAANTPAMPALRGGDGTIRPLDLACAHSDSVLP